MPEVVNIASLTIDVDDVIKESVKLKKQLDGLKQEQKELTKSSEEGTEQWIANDLAIRKLSKSYKDNQQLAVALDSTNEDLNKTLEVQGKSTQELYTSRSELQKISKNIIGNTEEEVALREQLNGAIDEQTEAIRSQSSSYIQGKDSIGEYTQGINASDLSIQSLIKNSEEAGGATNLMKGGLKAATQGMLSFTKSALAFIATPVGVVLAVVAGAFLLIKNAMNRSEESTTKVKKAMSAFTGIIQSLLKFLQPLGDFLIDGLVAGFELVEKGVFKALETIQKGLKFLGLDKAAASLGNFTEEVEKSVESSKKLTEAQLEFDKAQRIARKTQLLYQKDAEKLRQIRDDISKTEAERLQANADLGKLLTKQGKEEAALAQKSIDLAKLKIDLYGETKDSLDELAAAETELVDIEERLTGQTSEQLVNRESLKKEFADKRKSEEEKAAKESEEIEKARVEASIELAEYELSEYIRLNESKLEADKFVTEEALKLEEERLNNLAQKRREFAAKELEEGKLSQLEYNQAINDINAENDAVKEENRIAQEEAEKERQAIDTENYFTLLEENTNRQLEVQLGRLEQERLNEVAEAQKTGADVTLINSKFASRQLKLEKEINDKRLKDYDAAFGGIQELLGETTAAGKTAGIAQATINTYQGVTEVWKAPAVLPEPFNTAIKLGATATTLASGLSAVSKISGVSTQFSKGDILQGKSHAQGGIPFSIGGMLGFEAEGGEAIINKRSTSMFAPLLSEINQAGGGRAFANGGIAGATGSAPSSGLLDIDALASTLAEANASLPPPVVSVSEINEVDSGVKVVEDIATI